jgi:hypothetical protein
MVQRTMVGAKDVDCRAAFEDALAIAQSARSATSGWRAICVRERRRLGSSVIEPLASLDLDDDVARFGGIVRELIQRSPDDVDTLVFGLFDAIDDGSGGNAGFHVAPVASYRRHVDDFMRDPWKLERRFLCSRVLDKIAAAAATSERTVRPLLEYALSFGAAALTGRFAAAGLAHRIVVAFDDDRGPMDVPRYAELVVASRSRAPSAVAWPLFAPRLVQAC